MKRRIDDWLFLIVLILLVISILPVMNGCSAVVGGFEPKEVDWITTAGYSDSNYEAVWGAVVAVVSSDFNIAIVDGSSGYLQTSWKKVDRTAEEIKESSYINQPGLRVTCQLQKQNPFKLKLKVERAYWRQGILESDGHWVTKSSDEEMVTKILSAVNDMLKQ